MVHDVYKYGHSYYVKILMGCNGLVHSQPKQHLQQLVQLMFSYVLVSAQNRWGHHILALGTRGLRGAYLMAWQGGGNGSVVILVAILVVVSVAVVVSVVVVVSVAVAVSVAVSVVGANGQSY